MSWIVNFNIVTELYGSRPTEGLNTIWVGERVHFTLSLSGDPPSRTIEIAQNPRTWSQLPQMIITGYQSGGRPVPITVEHLPSNLLEFEYTFRYEGLKRLEFAGIPQQYRQEFDPFTRGSRVRPAMLPVPSIQIIMELQVLNSRTAGSDVASAQGRSGRSRVSGQRERQARADYYERVDASRRAEITDDRQRRREAASQHRTISGVRAHVVDFSYTGYKSPSELGGMLVSEVEDYLLNFQAAIEATVPLDLNRGPTSRGMLSPDTSYHWESEWVDEQSIAFFQVPHVVSGRASISDSEKAITRGRTEVVFPSNCVIAVFLPDSRRKALLPAIEIHQDLWLRQFWASFEAISLFSGIVTAPASTIAGYLGDLLLETFLPRNILTLIRGIENLYNLFSGLRFALSLGTLFRDRVRATSAPAERVPARPLRRPSRERVPASASTDEGAEITSTGDRGADSTVQPSIEARGLPLGSRGMTGRRTSGDSSVSTASIGPEITPLSELNEELIRYWEGVIQRSRVPGFRARTVAQTRELARRIEDRELAQDSIRRLRERQRPSHLQSEREMQYLYSQAGGRGETPFIHGRRAASQFISGHVRPDDVTSSAAIEVKNYYLPDSRQVHRLIATLVEQISARRLHLPYDILQQSIILDARGLVISEAQLIQIAQRISDATGLPIRNIQIAIW